MTPIAAVFAPGRLMGAVSPLIVWSLHFLLVYCMQGLACARHWQLAMAGPLPLVSWWQVLATVLTFALIGWLGWRAWRALAGVRAGSAAGPEAAMLRRRFMTTVTLASAVLSAIAVVFTTLPLVLLPPCA